MQAGLRRAIAWFGERGESEMTIEHAFLVAEVWMKKQTFVVCVMRDRAGCLIGQLSDPVEGWRRPLLSPEALWLLLMKGEGAGEGNREVVDGAGPDESTVTAERSAE